MFTEDDFLESANSDSTSDTVDVAEGWLRAVWPDLLNPDFVANVRQFIDAIMNLFMLDRMSLAHIGFRGAAARSRFRHDFRDPGQGGQVAGFLSLDLYPIRFHARRVRV